MTKEELKLATTEQLLEEIDYTGSDSYYREYRGEIFNEIRDRLNRLDAAEHVIKHESVPISKIRSMIAELQMWELDLTNCLGQTAKGVFSERLFDIVSEYTGYTQEEMDEIREIWSKSLDEWGSKNADHIKH